MSALPLPELDDVVEDLPAVIDLPVRDEEPDRPRTPLALLASRPARRRRAPFIILCVLVVIGVVASVLAMNVSVARTQYQLVQLRNDEKDLTQSNEALTAELNNRRAPQNLAEAAAKLNMVPAGQAGTLDLESGKVSGTAEAAVKPDAKDSKADKALLSKPLTPTEQEALNVKKQAARQAAQNKATAEANGTATGTDAAGTANSTTGGTTTSGSSVGSATGADANTTGGTSAQGKNDKGVGSGKAKPSVDENGNPIFSKKELGGGTIPAPNQSN